MEMIDAPLKPPHDARLAQPDMTESEIRQWIVACNHEPARRVLRTYLAMREGTANMLRLAEKNGWNGAIVAARELQPCTAENPREDAYQSGRFDGVMDYATVLRDLAKRT